MRSGDGGWDIRLARRNGTKTDGYPWEPGPKRFFADWDTAYRQATASRSSLDSGSSPRPAGSR